MVYQAIETKFLGATNYRGSRIKAACEAGSITVNWDYELDVIDNHRRAAEMLREKLGWFGTHYGDLHMGALPGAGYAFVFDGRDHEHH